MPKVEIIAGEEFPLDEAPAHQGRHPYCRHGKHARHWHRHPHGGVAVLFGIAALVGVIALLSLAIVQPLTALALLAVGALVLPALHPGHRGRWHQPWHGEARGRRRMDEAPPAAKPDGNPDHPSREDK